MFFEQAHASALVLAMFLVRVVFPEYRMSVTSIRKMALPLMFSYLELSKVNKVFRFARVGKNVYPKYAVLCLLCKKVISMIRTRDLSCSLTLL